MANLPGFSTSDLSYLTPEMKEKAEKFMYHCRIANPPIYIKITSTFRDQIREDAINRNLGKKTFISDHTLHNAFDFVPDGLKAPLIDNCEAGCPEDEALFHRCGVIADTLQLRWGGTFNKKDHVHCDNRYNGKKIEPYVTISTSEVKQIPGTQSLDNSVTLTGDDEIRFQEFNDKYSILENFTIKHAGSVVSEFNDEVNNIKRTNIVGLPRTNKFIQRIINGRPKVQAMLDTQ